MSSRTDDAAPPRPSRGLVWRGLLAGALIALSTAAAVSASVLLFVGDLRPPQTDDIPGLVKPESGEPQTLMILGSDRRHGDEKPPRSDTILLVRLDPDADATAVMSIPRDLLVDGRRINAAFEQGGAAGTLRAVKRLLSTRARPFPVHHVITADFSGFRRAIDEIGCVYADIDRDYFNDQGGPGGYAVIDIDPGYQKLCGADALAYVRYRHTDNDLVRAARQQDFLRQARRQEGIRELLSYDPGNLRRVARLFGRYFRTDRGLRDTQELVRLAKVAMYSAGRPVREVPFDVAPAPGDPNSFVASRRMLRRTVAAFLGAPRRPARQDAPRAAPRRRPARAQLVDARAAGEDRAILAAGELRFPFRFPARITRGATYVGDAARTYALRAPDGRRHDAYRLVLSTGRIGEYYGVQGTTWQDPPILADEPETVVRRGRRLEVHRDGARVRLVAWRTRDAVYWVANTLTRTLSADEMLGVAASLRRFGR